MIYKCSSFFIKILSGFPDQVRGRPMPPAVADGPVLTFCVQ